MDATFPRLRRLHADPDVWEVEDFLTADEAASVVAAASAKDLTRSPTVYAGWTEDARELLSLCAGGPAVWAALVPANGALQAGEGYGAALGAFASAWAAAMAAAGAAVLAWVRWREQGLAELRTSSSVTLYGESVGDRALVHRAERLLRSDWSTFEAPTVIRYEPGERLAPHYDANRSAETEDAGRGGQTLATLLVYLTDGAEKGGRTLFGKLDLAVTPKKGSALLFFPAHEDGTFDERLEHEGEEAVEEKWVARIWKHQRRVPYPYGLTERPKED